MNQEVQAANIILSELKEKVIGIYQHPTIKTFELITDINSTNTNIDSFFISNLGAVNQQYGIPIGAGKYHLFPIGKNMNDMLKDPFEFNKFIEQFK